MRVYLQVYRSECKAKIMIVMSFEVAASARKQNAIDQYETREMR